MDCSLPDSSADGILQNTGVVSLLPSPGDLPDPEIEQGSPALQADSLSTETPGKPTNLDSILQSRDITFLTKVHIVKAMTFPIVMYGYESWT